MSNDAKSNGVVHAPSIRRRDAKGWLATGAVAGCLAGGVALWALWRPLPWLPIPQGTLAQHAGFWIKLAAHHFVDGAFDHDARAYARFWREIGSGSRAQIIWRAAAATCAAGMPLVFLAPKFLTRKDGLTFLRGSTRYEDREAVDRLREKMAKFGRLDHEIAPGVPFPSAMWTRHTLVVGGTGAGKSTILRPLIQKIIDADEQLLLFDPKGEFTSGFERPSIIAPWDRRSLAWDLAKDLRNLLDMRRFAAAMVRDSHDPMWSNASRQLIVGLLVHLKAERGEDWGWRELAELIVLPQSALLAIMRACHSEAIRAVETASVTTAGVLINLSAFCSPIFDLAMAWGDAPKERRVSMIEWTEGRSPHRQLVIQGHGAYSDLTKSCVEGMVGVFAARINSVETDDDSTRKLWFVADEFGQAGKLPVRPLFEVGRSRGVRCAIACQDFAQLEELYGEKAIRALLAMCGTLIVGELMPGETSEAICRTLGGREVERRNVSVSQGEGGSRTTSVSYSRDEISLYKPSELASRLGKTEDGAGVKMVLFTRGEAYELAWPYCSLQIKRPAHEPAPWTLGVPSAMASPPLASSDDVNVSSAKHASNKGGA
ncbi:type IV secretion system DNA-binding domain-containing protein [Paraburkholderia nemoris]|uniref:type IV secretion system DNA-binding domain-containing protein n=1 Tax=Paraburkholderia nemoris TaxID=2793076 RepID=UPI0038BDD261